MFLKYQSEYDLPATVSEESQLVDALRTEVPLYEHSIHQIRMLCQQSHRTHQPAVTCVH